MVNWIQTVSGRKFEFAAPLGRSAVREYSLLDIGHALSNICRFGGHTKKFYSVAEHCVRVAGLVPDQYRLEALLHDAAEAYIGDITSPMKSQFPLLASVEDGIRREIFAFVGLPLELSAPVKHADLVMLHTEALGLLDNPLRDDWTRGLPGPVDVDDSFWGCSAFEAEKRWLDEVGWCLVERFGTPLPSTMEGQVPVL